MIISEDQDIGKNFLELFRVLIHQKLGIYISKEKDYLIINKIGKLMRSHNYKTLLEFYFSLKNGNKESLEQLIRYITTNHTFFFREKVHLKILRNDIILRKLEKPLIWCAACSTGEEVYSLIIELLESNITNFFIIATDINSDVLMTCKRGIYKKNIAEHIEKNILYKYFNKIDDEKEIYYKVKPELKKFFIVKKINLIDTLLFEQKFNYILCRNVLIYFNLETQQKVVQNLIKNMDDLGYLFVGHSENLFTISNELETVFTSVYNKRL